MGDTGLNARLCWGEAFPPAAQEPAEIVASFPDHRTIVALTDDFRLHRTRIPSRFGGLLIDDPC